MSRRITNYFAVCHMSQQREICCFDDTDDLDIHRAYAKALAIREQWIRDMPAYYARPSVVVYRRPVILGPWSAAKTIC